MSSARRPLLTATAAGTLLCALWFVPTANATQETGTADRAGTATRTTTQVSTQARATTADAAGTATGSAAAARSAANTSAGPAAADGLSDAGARLADTGSFDTTPYLVGGTTLLALGAGFVVYSVRRERLGF
ncbi:LPXTG cell wall anchor domain-containing protein [Streptomyces galbus]|uniref:LPXTG cell wall anchor domain-containing protein n=1 Tax=Streptomyces galbus TaxID=33898 RepID=A0ABX1ISG8_STRGB|nr:LPXTG cell wall anchor domain-containing protein [Streptomyces galbus]NKQ27206.1 LPXTG cell wall anchor domain-containing protein [Streptomyces galbus]